MSPLEEQMIRDRRRLKGLVVATLLGLVAFGLLVWRPSLREANRMDGKITARQAELDATRTRTSVLPTVSKDVEQLRAFLDKSHQPSRRDEFADLIRALDEFTQRTRLSGFNYEPGTPKRLEETLEQPITLRFSGDFANVFEFFRQVEDLHRLMRVRDASIKALGADGRVDVELTLNLYSEAG